MYELTEWVAAHTLYMFGPHRVAALRVEVEPSPDH